MGDCEQELDRKLASELSSRREPVAGPLVGGGEEHSRSFSLAEVFALSEISCDEINSGLGRDFSLSP